MRLIDADALINTLNKEKIQFNAAVNYFILNAPTIDAVQVIRCKDCEYYEGDYSYCANERLATHDDYCSHGRKKQKETEGVYE